MRPLRRQSRIEEVSIPSQKNHLDEASSDMADTNLEYKNNNETNYQQSGSKKHSLNTTDNKPTTNWQQTGNNDQQKPTTNWQQSGNKPTTKKINKNETGNKVGTQPTTRVATKWQQTDNKVATNPSFSSAVGLQRNIVLFIYNSCKISRNKITLPLTLEHIANSLKTSSGTIKTTIQRLEKKSLIKRVEFKNGRGGWSKYELADSVYRELLQLETDNKPTTKWQQTDNKLGTQPATEPATAALSSSSYLNTTTNYQAPAAEIFNFEIPDELKKIGFAESHLLQLKRDSKLPPESISASLEALAYDLTFEDVKKKIRSPIGLIMKLLKASEPYLSEKGYESEEDRLFRECVRRTEKQVFEKNKLKEKFLDLKFEEWLELKTKDELMAIEAPVGEFMGVLHRSALKEFYFKNEFEVKEGGLQ